MGLALVVSSLFYFVALQMQIQGCNGCLEKERMGLLEIKAYIVEHDGDPDSELASWIDDRASNCCTWNRVKCSNISTGHVTDISLEMLLNYWGANLTFNVSLFRPFEELLSLDLSDIGFQGWNDNEGFPRLQKLETLDLGDNGVNSSILSSLNGLTSLRTLKLGFNWMNGLFSTQGFLRSKKLEVLALSGNSLNSSILPSLNEFTSLRSLLLDLNQIDGSFSTLDFAKFSRLELLDLSFNRLTGSLDVEDLQNLRSLKMLDLSYNQLNGTIEGLCEMKNLEELVLSNNMFSGQIPECLSILKNLKVLHLSDNLFSGNFPSFISNLTSLGYLSLLENNMQGSFSLSTLANHSKLQVLHISSKSPKAHIETEKTQWFPTFQLKSLILRSCNLNKDKGSVIPSFLLYQYDMQFIDLSHNKINGSFPSWLIQNKLRREAFFSKSNTFVGNVQLSSIGQGIRYLDISNNSISGLLPKDIGIFLSNITYLNLSRNNFEGKIPASIGEMKELKSLDFSRNHFSGELPEQLVTNCINLYYLKLSNNFLQGNIKSFDRTNLRALYLNNNNFSGTLEKVLAKNTRLSVLDISNNSISGVIPSSIGKFSSMEILLMADNQLEGEIPFGFSNMTRLQMLDLSQNRLSGLVPYFNLSFMRFLYLQKNALSGSIPFTLSKSLDLVILDLRDNKFFGNIPYWMDKFSELRALLLGGNNFDGDIPESLCRLKNVNIMDLSHNKINGSIPSCFKNLPFGIVGYDDNGSNFQMKSMMPDSFPIDFIFNANLVLLDHPLNSQEDDLLVTVDFRTKSNYYSYTGDILENMTGLDFSCNKLTGIIPPQIGNLQQIRALNLSHNYLSGPIPKTFSNLTQIESLDLSYNNLSGEIPSQLTQLYFLSIFNVSYNNLSGIPPTAGQFQNFDDENYKGNPGLCGSLLKQKCKGATTSPPSQSNSTEGKETTVDMVVFYWSFTASYITILLGFITVLCVNAYWRMAWFYFIGKVIRRCFPTFPLY